MHFVLHPFHRYHLLWVDEVAWLLLLLKILQPYFHHQSNVVVTVGIPEADVTPCGNKLAFSIYVPKTNTTTCRSQATSCIEVTIVKNAGFFSVCLLPSISTPHVSIIMYAE